MSQLKEDLLAVAALLEGPGAWCQGELARDRAGVEVYPHDPRAWSWCLEGGILVVLPPQTMRNRGRYWAVIEAVDAALPGTPIDWNDAPERTQGEVVGLLRAVAEGVE